MKYIREFDGKEFSEEEVYEDAASQITWDEISDAMSEISIAYLFNHLDESAQEVVRNCAIAACIENCYCEVDDEEDEEDADI